MSSDITPSGNHAAALADDDNRYQATQAKLDTLAKVMDGAMARLEGLRRRARATADRAGVTADRIADAQLDPKFVEMTGAVAQALGGPAARSRTLDEMARDVAAGIRDVQRTHARLYQGLDEVRSTRRERTPKPGFFAN